MSAAAIVMILLGCGDGDGSCMTVGQAEATYASEAECRAAMAQVLPARSDIAFPVVAARCEPAPQVTIAQAVATLPR